MSELKSFLISLGDDANSIAEYLRINKINGHTRSICTCPISNLLKEKFGYIFVGVCDEEIGIQSEFGIEDFKIPNNIIKFIHRFDQGAYPDLVKKGE